MAETRGSHSTVGISNRESPQEEAEERREHPPTGANAPSRNAVAGEGDPVSNASTEQQTSRKSGVRSTAQKEAESKYADRPMPATSRTDGAFGQEKSGEEDTK
jgi:hypothetical protein